MRAHLAPVGGGGPAPCCPGPLLAAPWPPPAPAPHPPVLYGVLPGDGGRLARRHAVALRAPVLGTISKEHFLNIYTYLIAGHLSHLYQSAVQTWHLLTRPEIRHML